MSKSENSVRISSIVALRAEVDGLGDGQHVRVGVDVDRVHVPQQPVLEVLEGGVAGDGFRHDAAQQVAGCRRRVHAVVGLEVVAAAMYVEVVGHVVERFWGQPPVGQDVSADLYERAGGHDVTRPTRCR